MKHCLHALTVVDDAAIAAQKARDRFPVIQNEAKKAGEESYEAVRATALSYVRYSARLAHLTNCADYS